MAEIPNQHLFSIFLHQHAPLNRKKLLSSHSFTLAHQIAIAVRAPDCSIVLYLIYIITYRNFLMIQAVLPKFKIMPAFCAIRPLFRPAVKDIVFIAKYCLLYKLLIISRKGAELFHLQINLRFLLFMPLPQFPLFDRILIFINPVLDLAVYSSAPGNRHSLIVNPVFFPEITEKI